MLSILLATIISIGFGALWYGPKTNFYGTMFKAMGIDEKVQAQRVEEKFNPTFHFGMVFLAEFTLAIIIYGLLMVTNNDFRIMIFPIFFVFVSNIKTNVFTFISLKVFLIQEVQKIIAMLLMGAVISFMM